MSTKLKIEAIDTIITGLNNLKDALNEGTNDVVSVKNNNVNIELLAHQMAYSYTTLHPEYRVESQFRNLRDMINSTKISYVIAWVRKRNVEELNNFFALDTEAKREVMLEALNKYEQEIKEVFTKRFT